MLERIIPCLRVRGQDPRQRLEAMLPSREQEPGPYTYTVKLLDFTLPPEERNGPELEQEEDIVT